MKEPQDSGDALEDFLTALENGQPIQTRHGMSGSQYEQWAKRRDFMVRDRQRAALGAPPPEIPFGPVLPPGFAAERRRLALIARREAEVRDREEAVAPPSEALAEARRAARMGGIRRRIR